jgi:hypothetical protein
MAAGSTLATRGVVTGDGEQMMGLGSLPTVAVAKTRDLTVALVGVVRADRDVGRRRAA